MVKRLLILFICSAISAICYTSCVHKPQVPLVPPDGNYPPEVANIIMNKCAISGCHNQASYQNANGLLLDTWDHLLDGGVNGAEIIAYSPQYSPLVYTINTDTTGGKIAVKPSMPLSTPGRTFAPLTTAEYNIIYNWIAAGAPDKNGNIPFASDADTRQKIYLTLSGNDIMAVIDGQRKVVMRYIPMGADSSFIEYAHEVEFSEDGKYAYVVFYSGNYIQKIDVTIDKVIGQVDMSKIIPPGGSGWSVICMSPTDTQLAATNYSNNGGFGIVNTNTMQTKTSNYYGGSFTFVYPHGIACTPSFDTFFVTAEYGNTIYKYSMRPTTYYGTIPIKGTSAYTSNTLDSSSPNPHQIEMAPDNSKYFVTCQGTNEVRVMDAHSNHLLAVIPVGVLPQEMTLSASKNYLLVTCQEDNANPLPGRKGSVYVIDYNTYAVVKILYGDFYQPHDLCVDEKDGYIFIASTNLNPNGPAPHHPIQGGGRAGWYTVYSLSTLEPVDNKRYEVLIDPYAMNARF